jgi:hypothetical protein
MGDFSAEDFSGSRAASEVLWPHVAQRSEKRGRMLNLTRIALTRYIILGGSGWAEARCRCVRHGIYRDKARLIAGGLNCKRSLTATGGLQNAPMDPAS